jgi:hypothetical protein
MDLERREAWWAVRRRFLVTERGEGFRLVGVPLGCQDPGQVG